MTDSPSSKPQPAAPAPAKRPMSLEARTSRVFNAILGIALCAWMILVVGVFRGGACPSETTATLMGWSAFAIVLLASITLAVAASARHESPDLFGTAVVETILAVVLLGLGLVAAIDANFTSCFEVP